MERAKDIVEQTAKQLITSLLSRPENQLLQFEEMVAPEFYGWETGPDEIMLSRDVALEFLQRDLEQLPDGMEVDFISVETRFLSDDFAVVWLELDAKLVGMRNVPMPASRFSVCLHNVATGSWQIVGGHAGVPWEAQAEGESLPVNELETRARKLEQEVAVRTEELFDRIKSDPQPLPVCTMMAYDNDDYRGKAAALKCDGYVSKPIDFAP
jgi:hypothetical protein